MMGSRLLREQALGNSDLMKHRVLLADGHILFQEAMRFFLQDDDTAHVVGQTSDGLQVVSMATDLAAHIVCIDIHMPGMDGAQVTRELRLVMPGIKVVAISAEARQADMLDILSAGADALITKTESSQELLHAVHALARGRSYLSPHVANVVSNAWMADNVGKKVPAVLGRRERQVLNLLTTGHSSTQIATLMLITVSTVEAHRRNIMRKLDRHNVADLTRYVIDLDRSESRFA